MATGDMRAENRGHMFVFTDFSDAGRAWLETNVKLNGWMADYSKTTGLLVRFSVQYRYAADIIVGAREAGLEVLVTRSASRSSPGPRV